MKKIFLMCTLLLVANVVVNSASQAAVMEPQWSEFCPPLYENAIFKPAKENSKRNMENNYWALRRAKFEKSIAECKAISQNAQELGVCYSRVANIEKNKSSQRKEAKYEKQDDINMQIRDGGYWWF